jgi:hypothetical protein
MTDAERIWREKSDDDLLVAAAELGTYTDGGQRIIREELRRRGLEDPVEQAGSIAPEPGATLAEDEDEPPVPNPEDEDGPSIPNPEDEDKPPVSNPRCGGCRIEQRFVGTKRFREGTNWGALGELGHLFEHSESFDVYVCPRCGHVDMFIDGVGEDTRPE